MLLRVVHFLRPTFFALVAFALVVGIRSAIQVTLGAPDGSTTWYTSPNDLNGLDLPGVMLPRPGLPPDQVVRLQLAGLRDTRADGVGVLQCYAFASPANRAVTGPLDRFGKMVRQGAFRCMAKPRTILIGRPQQTDRTARVLVTLIDDEDRLHAFTFVLGRQREAPFKDCWMTEAVLPSLPATTPSREAIPAA